MKVNKFSKRLLAFGLSTVTAVTMVSTVFADGIDTATNTDNETTQVQSTSATTKSVTVHFVDTNGLSIGNDVTVEVASGLEDGGEVSAVYQAAKSLTPNGYEINSGGITSLPFISKNDDGTYTATCVQYMDVTVTIKKSDDSSYQQVYTVSLPNYGYGSMMSNKVYNAVSQYIPDGYQSEISNLGRIGDGVYTLVVTPSGSTVETTDVTVVIQVDGVTKETTKTNVKTFFCSDETIMKQKVFDGCYSYNCYLYADGKSVDYTITKDESVENQYILNLITGSTDDKKDDVKPITLSLSVIKDGKEVGKESFSVDSTSTDDVIKSKVYSDYYSKYTNGDKVGGYNIEKNTDDSWTFMIYTIKDHTYNLIITKDDVVQPTVTFTVKNSTFCDSEAVAEYLQKNYVPEGYEGKLNGGGATIDDEYFNWGFVLTKKTDSSDKKDDATKENTPTIEESKDSTASLENKDKVVETLKISLKDNNLKDAYDNAISSNKKVVFVSSVTTTNLDAASEKAVKAEAAKLGYQTVEAFDITLAMTVDGKEVGTISETSSPLTFKVTIPENLKKEGRKFYILRNHDDKVETLDVDENGYFTTDKFSTYMLVYEDIKQDADKKDDSKSDTTDKKDDASSSTESTDNSGSSTTDIKKTNLVSSKTDSKKLTTSKSVNTSTKTNSSLFVGFGALALTGMAIVGVLKKKNELD